MLGGLRPPKTPIKHIWGFAPLLNIFPLSFEGEGDKGRRLFEG